MEANLNQFRLLTVRGEQVANARRSSSDRSSLDYSSRGIDPTSSLVPGHSASNGSICMSSMLAGYDCDTRVTDDCSAPPAYSTSTRLRPAGTHPVNRPLTTFTGHSDDGDVETSDDDEDEDEATEADRPKTSSDAEHTLISALRSLERTLNDHTQLMTKRLRRELTVKGANAETTVQAGVGTSPLPSKTAQRGDKVQLLPPQPATYVVYRSLLQFFTSK